MSRDEALAGRGNGGFPAVHPVKLDVFRPVIREVVTVTITQGVGLPKSS